MEDFAETSGSERDDFSPVDIPQMYFGLPPEEGETSGSGLLDDGFPPGISFVKDQPPETKEGEFGALNSDTSKVPPAYDPEADRLPLIFLGGPSWGGLWNPASDNLINMANEPQQIKAAAANMIWFAHQQKQPVKDIAPVYPTLQTAYSLTQMGGPTTDQELFDHLAQQMTQPDYRVPPTSLSPDGLTFEQRQAKINELENKAEPTPIFARGGPYLPPAAQEDQNFLESLKRNQAQHEANYNDWRASLVTPQNIRARAFDAVGQEDAAIDHTMMNSVFRTFAWQHGVAANPEDPSYFQNTKARALAAQWLAGQPDKEEWARDKAARIMDGAIDDTIEGGFGGAGLLADTLGLSDLGRSLKDSAEGAQEFGREQTDPRQDDYLSSKIAHGIGVAGGTILPGAGVGKAAEGLGASARVARGLTTFSVAGLGSAQNGWSVYQEALHQGATPKEALTASKWAALAGVISVIPMAKWANRLNDGGKTVNLVNRMILEALQNGGQAGAVTVADNVIAQQIYDEHRQAFEGMLPAVGANAIVGELMSVLTHAVSKGRAAAPSPEKEPKKPSEIAKKLAFDTKRTPIFRTWNEFQAGTAEQFADQEREIHGGENDLFGIRASAIATPHGNDVALLSARGFGEGSSDSPGSRGMEGGAEEARASAAGFRALGISRFVPVSDLEGAARVGYDESGNLHLEYDQDAIEGEEGLAQKRGLAPGITTRSLFGEELIHAAHLTALRNEWISSGREGSFTSYVANSNKGIFDDIQRTINDPRLTSDERLRLQQAAASAFHIYNSDLGQHVDMTPAILNRLSEGDQVTFVAEFLRMATQLKRQGDVREGIVASYLRKIEAWVRNAIEKIRGVLPEAFSGKFGDRTKAALESIERQLDSLEGKPPAAMGKVEIPNEEESF